MTYHTLKMKHSIDELLTHIITPRTAAEVAAITGIDVKKVRTTFSNRMRMGQVSIDGTGEYNNRKSYLYKKNDVIVRPKQRKTNMVRRWISLSASDWEKLQDMTNGSRSSEAIRILINQ